MITLIGLRGSGKTTVGRALADHLQRPFLDLDEDIERVAGKTVAELLKESEANFRELERTCLQNTLRDAPADLVLAPGGGAPAQKDNLIFFQYSIQIYLTAPAALLAERIAKNPGARPPLTGGGDLLSEIIQLKNERSRTYQKIADITIENDGTVDEAVAAVEAALIFYKQSEKLRFARLQLNPL